MNKIVVVFNMDTMSFEFKLEFFFRSCRRVLKTHSCRKTDINLLFDSMSTSIRTSITVVNIATATNNTSRIRIPPCYALFSQIVHNTKNKSNPKNMALRLTPYFLWLSQKSASNLNLMTKWNTYLIWMQNCKHCFTLRVAFYIVYAGLQPLSSTHARLLPFW